MVYWSMVFHWSDNGKSDTVPEEKNIPPENIYRFLNRIFEFIDYSRIAKAIIGVKYVPGSDIIAIKHVSNTFTLYIL